MVKIRAHRGLCETCRNDPTCTYPRNSGQPVLQCLDFEGFVAAPAKTISRNGSHGSNSRFQSNLEGKYTGKYMGLCRTCENRGVCTFPKPEGGIWHCDEYR
jgi:hypothetical protein